MKKTSKESVSEDETKLKSSAETTTVDDSLNVKPASASFDVKRSGLSGTPIKSEKIAKVISPDPVFGGQKTMGFNAAGFGSSGTGEGFLADFPKTPTSSKTRGAARFDKKVEKVANYINYSPSENFLIEFRESEPLSKASNKDVGFNGTYRTDVFRLQKKSGASPAELEYQRSVDFLKRDMVYFSDGQTIVPDGIAQAIYPTSKVITNEQGLFEYPKNGSELVNNYQLTRGNYILDDIHFQVSANGLDYVIFGETNVECHPKDNQVFDESSQAYTYAVNRAELEREDMDRKAGDEDKDGWSPLPRAIEQPTQVVALLHDMEYVTGTELYLAEKKFESAMAFQLNKAIKDGQSLHKPGVEALTRMVNEQYTGQVYSSSFMTHAFDRDTLSEGAASLIIPLFDSVAKYNTKADILLQPRGPRMHLASLRNSNRSFRVNPLFVQAFTSRESFATIDHDYDPSKPIIMTDRAVAAHPVSIAAFGNWGPRSISITASDDNMEISSTATGDTILPKGTIYHLHYRHMRPDANGVLTLVKNSDVDMDVTSAGGVDTVSMDFGAVNDSEKDDVVEVIISTSEATLSGYNTVSTTGGTLKFGALTNCVLSVNSRDFLGVGPYRYGYHDRRNNYSRTINLPLASGIRAMLSDYAGKFFSVLNAGLHGSDVVTRDVCVIATHSTDTLSFYDLMLAISSSYMVEDRKQSFIDVADYAENFGYPFSQTMTVADAVKVSYKNMIVSGMDEPLKTVVADTSLAVTWKFPETFTKLHVGQGVVKVLTPWYVNEANYQDISVGDPAVTVAARNPDEWNICWPSIRAGNYLSAFDDLYSLGEKGARLNGDFITDVTYGLDQVGPGLVYKHGLTTDGQLVLQLADEDEISGYQYLAFPRELGWSMVAPAGLLTSKTGRSDHNYGVSQIGNSSYRTVLYHNVTAEANPVGNVQPTLNGERAANFQQNFIIIHAWASSSTTPRGFYGVSLGSGDCYNSSLEPILNRASFEVLTDLSGRKLVSNVALNSDHTSLYYRLNVLPFVINPYDSQIMAGAGAAICDPYETAYIFGLCGFRASDFSLDVYNHLNEADNLGRLLVSNSRIGESYLK